MNTPGNLSRYASALRPWLLHSPVALVRHLPSPGRLADPPRRRPAHPGAPGPGIAVRGALRVDGVMAGDETKVRQRSWFQGREAWGSGAPFAAASDRIGGERVVLTTFARRGGFSMSFAEFRKIYTAPSDRLSAIHQCFVSLERSEDWCAVSVQRKEGHRCGYVVHATAPGRDGEDAPDSRSFVFFVIPFGISLRLEELHGLAAFETAEREVVLAVTTENRVLLHWVKPMLDEAMLGDALELKSRSRRHQLRERRKRKRKERKEHRIRTEERQKRMRMSFFERVSSDAKDACVLS